ncbi:3-oxoacyl-ACP reductase [Pollutimonas harenae]|uniref:3-oxoacyl-ACP reductase n=1 Tax=Pollutimonas harenae TaxID=657015 RepID=A0A853H2L0_9BURK|nr:3-oxoacyl-ACP reductase [Pollutimonas harenae]NYT84813.1 3-oxoacyl-ACP reductase [Pollutimonas harenae]TEA72789.1 SDR family oxidoreductase [Pollutimonas harenae]
MSTRRVALVTGAGKGIGLAATLALLKAERSVAMVDRNVVDVAALIPQEYQPFVRLHTFDVTDTVATIACLEQVRAELGEVSILVNNAGISPKKNGKSSGLLEVSDTEWDDVMSVNVKAIVRLCQLCVPAMKAQRFGRIVNISSLAGRSKSIVAGISYMASKSAVLGLSRAIASEMGPYGITTNCVAPGRILTEMAMQAGPEVNEQYAQAIPVRRLGTPEEVGDAITFLCQDSSGFINGAVIDINGGFYMP